MSAISIADGIPCRRRSVRRRWAAERLLAIGTSDWLIHRTWPHLPLLQKDLARHTDEDFDLLRAAKRLPPDCGRLDGDLLVITVKGLHRTGAVEHLLADFMEAVRLAHARYLRLGAPTVSAADLADVLYLSEERVQLVGQLLDAETDLFARMDDAPAQGHTWAVKDAIFGYREAKDVDRYLAIQQEAARRARPTGVRERAREWRTGVQVTRGDLLAIAVAAAVLGAAVPLIIGATPLAPSDAGTTTITVPVSPPPRPHRAPPRLRHRRRGVHGRTTMTPPRAPRTS
jgi:hypothetical protein